ncbi:MULTISPECIES: CerR family C-terminal domain-containing protein [unclassified Pseudovibrio]|uniref:CerR family C-terminal domain-containing protein n=1 Tax=unclassified Pseudovibrio TaxID=2627060 RepID=UPI0007AE3B28|nr:MULTISPECIES: CerR family C-terminal domain-containing protein [unclassified Pseudovibrio]KZL00524.1 putative HTH-type transcriptional regulator YttP [Pseudovibrio sp. W74]KZL07699.1 putative HTH-type transcriptional regulator YttP [Pseudovibrio sp. Ad14]
MTNSPTPNELREVLASDTPSAKTKRDLIESALYHFGREGYAGTSTRSIAQTAKANIASIAYHFDGKAGLKRACINFIAMSIGDVMSVVLNRKLSDIEHLSPEDARTKILEMIDRMITFTQTNKRAELVIGFMLKEVLHSPEEVDTLYHLIFEPLMDRVTVLFSRATGQPVTSDELKLAIFAMIGQLLYIRLARPLVLKRMGWQAVGPDELAQIKSILHRSINALLDELSKGSNHA